MKRVALLLLLAAAGPAAAGGLRPVAAPVPPTQEIVVLDPGVDPTGLPTPHIKPGAFGAAVEIPPAIIVHRYYYTGDRTFQGPMLPGGPTLVSVNHPITLERVQVPVTMPPGAPKVTYAAKEIRYDYGPQSVILSFGPCGKPTVRYSQASKFGESVRGAVSAATSGAQTFMKNSVVTQGVKRLADGTKQTLGEGVDRVRETAKSALETRRLPPKPDLDLEFQPRKE